MDLLTSTALGSLLFQVCVCLCSDGDISFGPTHAPPVAPLVFLPIHSAPQQKKARVLSQRPLFDKKSLALHFVLSFAYSLNLLISGSS